jgi:hypothetical protein
MSKMSLSSLRAMLATEKNDALSAQQSSKLAPIVRRL